MADVNQLTIETPEQVELEYQIAGIGSRFMAFAIDTLYEILLFTILGLAMAFVIPSLERYIPKVGPMWMDAIGIFVFFAIYWGYFAFFEAIWSGQTPGKRSIGIRVVKDSGRRINTFEAISRNLLRSIDQVPGIYVIGFLSMAISKEHRRIGDYVAGTVVVHERATEQFDADLQDLSIRSAMAFQTEKLSSKDLELIEGFLHRRLSLDATIRENMARKIALHVSGKLNEGVPPDANVEDFLQAVAKAIRDNG
jgi:uncharacterized RDD family membrane protein YckC